MQRLYAGSEVVRVPVNLEELKAQVEEALGHRHDDFCRERSGWGGTPPTRRTNRRLVMTERLTNAELNALGRDANWDTRYGERAITELRELRAEVEALRKAVRICPNCGPVEISHYCLGISPADASHKQEPTRHTIRVSDDGSEAHASVCEGCEFDATHSQVIGGAP